MALTPHAKDPNREKNLKDINEMINSGSEGKGIAKQRWNMNAAPKVQPTKASKPDPVENPELKDKGDPKNPGPKGEGKGK